MGLATLLLLATGACSSSSISLPPDTTTTAEGLVILCALYRNVKLIDHNTGDSELNERSWKQHLRLASNLVSFAPRQIEGAVWDYLHIVEAQGLLVEQLEWIDTSKIPVEAQQSLNAQLRPLLNGAAALKSFTNKYC